MDEKTKEQLEIKIVDSIKLLRKEYKESKDVKLLNSSAVILHADLDFTTQELNNFIDDSNNEELKKAFKIYKQLFINGLFHDPNFNNLKVSIAEKSLKLFDNFTNEQTQIIIPSLEESEKLLELTLKLRQEQRRNEMEELEKLKKDRGF